MVVSSRDSGPVYGGRSHQTRSEVKLEELRSRLATVIFGTETPAGRAFDVTLLVLIMVSITVIALDSVPSLRRVWGDQFSVCEGIFTVLFTVEYLLRLYSASRRLRYAFSFFGVVDLASVLPSYAGLVFSGVESLLVIRVLRLLRVFRVLKVVRMLKEATQLLTALRASIPKISVFLGAVMTIVVIIGAAMHLIEGAENGFTSIPRAMYWAIVTLTTVGYGDIAPATVPGQALAAVVMVLGYGVLAVPTGIVSAEMIQQPKIDDVTCRSCGTQGHEHDAHFCRICGEELV